MYALGGSAVREGDAALYVSLRFAHNNGFVKFYATHCKDPNIKYHIYKDERKLIN